MLKIYCSKCGALNAYVSVKPNFCQKCGNQIAAATVDASEISQDIDTEEDSVPQEEARASLMFDQLDGLEVDIVVRGPQRDKVGDLAGTAQGKMDDYPNQTEQRDYDIEEEFKKEAGAIKPNEKGGKKET